MKGARKNSFIPSSLVHKPYSMLNTHMSNSWSDFNGLSPDLIYSSLRDGFGIEPQSLINHLPSYINRVYEMESSNSERYVIKFYRPGRWTEDAIMDEHDLLFHCVDSEIPVVAPLLTPDGSSLCTIDDFHFALFPKRSGRLFETNTEDDYLRLGRLIGRLHSVSSTIDAPDRITLSPELMINEFLEHLISGKLITANEEADFREVVTNIMTVSIPLFKEFNTISCHGDCHRGNILDRADEGLLLIDFDDMCAAPEVQDLWMLLPGYAAEAKKEWFLMLEGYSEFRAFNDKQIVLVEPLRAMRMLYYLSWSARQLHDYHFKEAYPDWGNSAFWSKEIGDFRIQLQVIRESLQQFT